MSISNDDVKHVARLAKFRLSDDAATKLGSELNTILTFIDQLESADVTGVEPTKQVTGMTDALRKDAVNECEDPQGLVKMAPRSSDGSFVVRAVHG